MDTINKTTPDMALKKMARAAILRAKGDTEEARIVFAKMMIDADSAALERELHSAYRNTAIRTLLATHYQELRSEGKLPQLRKPTWIPTTNHDRPVEKPPRPSDWQWDDEIGMTAKAHIRRYLETFMVNGKPIGDCRVDEVDAAAGVRESDARFMRALVEGLPPDVIVRDHRTEEDAAKVWQFTRENL
jgi:hypothetical protein